MHSSNNSKGTTPFSLPKNKLTIKNTQKALILNEQTIRVTKWNMNTEQIRKATKFRFGNGENAMAFAGNVRNNIEINELT